MTHRATPRLAPLVPAGLGARQRRLYDAIPAGPRARGGSPFPLVAGDGSLTGPFNAMLLQPELGEALQTLGSTIRYATTLSPRAREIAILLVAHHWDSTFERTAHESAGRAAGLTDHDLAAVRAGHPADLPDTTERLVAATVLALTTHGRLTDEEFTAARDGLGLPQVFELTTLVGYYATLALQMRVFGPDRP